MTSSSSNIIHLDLPADDPIKRKPDISLAKNKLNWQPRFTRRDGLKETIHFFKDLLNKKMF